MSSGAYFEKRVSLKLLLLMLYGVGPGSVNIVSWLSQQCYLWGECAWDAAVMTVLA